MGVRQSALENMVADFKINAKFWKDKKILLTGHTGFKGSWMSIWLKSLGVDLIGYSLLPPTKPSLFEIANVKEGMISIEGNVLDFENFKKTIEKYKPEIIIHMAAQSLVHYSYLNPQSTYATNVMGTVNLLEAVRQTGKVKVVLNITSDKCYENKNQEVGYKEEDPMGGYDPYSSSKGCAELVTSAYLRSFFNPNEYSKHGIAVASARAGNVIGGGDWASNRLIPDIVRTIFNATTLKIRNPNAIRPWQHVLEPLSGYLLLVEKLWEGGAKYSEAWNFGPDDTDVKPVNWIVEKFIKLWGENVKREIDSNEKPHETQLLKLDCTKAKTKLNWKPKWDIDKALEKTADWYKALKEKNDMRDFSLSQIKEYNENLIKV